MVSNSGSRLRLLAFATATLAAASSFGIIATTTYGAPVDSTGMFPYVGFVDGFGGSGVAVGPNVFLTAGHVVPGGISNGNTTQTFTLNGTLYSIASSVAAPDIMITDPMTGQPVMTHVDLSLVYVNGSFSSPYASIASSMSLGSTINMVGYGQTGGVNTTGTGYAPNFTSGDRMYGANTIDDTYEYYVAPGTGGLNSAGGGPLLLSYLYQAGDAVQAVGDSGGAWFQGSSLVGISSIVFSTNTNLPSYGFASNNGGTPYFGSAAINLTDPRLRGFLASIRPQPTPEPASMFAFGVGTMVLVRRRRRS